MSMLGNMESLNVELEQLLAQQRLSRHQLTKVFNIIMDGQVSDVSIAAFLMAMRMMGETSEEITSVVSVLRDKMTKVAIQSTSAIDIVGTGGDGANIFNVSTGASFIAATGGVTVAKHGNRSLSSNSGAADVLQQMGIHIELSPTQIARCIDDLGIGFMFAPIFHPALKHVMHARKQLGVRTLFNLVGPLCNPAGVKRQLLGVYDKQWAEPVAQVLKMLGSENVLVVHSEDGLDEISIAAPTYVVELKDSSIVSYTIRPEDFSMQSSSLADLKVKDAKQSWDVIKSVFSVLPHANQGIKIAGNMMALNAGAALYVAGVADSIKQGVDIAIDCLASGLVMEKVTDLVAMSQLMSES